MQYDVIIIGGGMVGSALALALSNAMQSGQMPEQKIALIEPNPATMPQQNIEQVADIDMRVSAIHRGNQAFLQSIGAWQGIPQHRLSAYDKMRVWDGTGTGHIQFDAAEMTEPCLGHIIENRCIASALIHEIQQQGKIRLITQKTTEIERLDEENESYYVHLDNGDLLKSSMIVAADGARSFIRQWAEFETREWDYQHHGLVCTIRTERSHQTCAWQRFTADGVLAFLPLPQDANGQDNLVSIVYSCSPEKAESLLALSDEEFCRTLASEFEYQLGAVLEVGPRAAIPLRQRHAKSYVKSGIVLIGDAAHTIHPLAGQGVNLGLMDANVLAQEWIRASNRGLALSDGLTLQRFERRRMGDNLSMMVTMEGFKRLFAPQPPAINWLRNWGMNKVNQAPMIKHHIMQLAMGL